MNLNRVQFYPSKALSDILSAEASKKGVSVSQLVTDLLENYYGVSTNSSLSITHLTTIVLNEVEGYVKQANAHIPFDLNMASSTYRNIEMIRGKKPSTIRASIGRSFVRKIGIPPFTNVRKYIVNDKQQLSPNNALLYETF